MDKSQLAIMCDFDGTITKIDVGHQIYTRFGDEKWLEINNRWRRGEISSRDCLIGEYDLIDADEQEVMEHILKMEIDPGFIKLAALCKANDIPLSIASDGFDFYINAVLDKYGLKDIPVFCNEMKFNGRKVELSFPYYEQGCGVCGNCKRLHVENFKKTVIYIGDGLSDRYAAKTADIVFAKDELMDYLNDNNVKFIQFSNLDDINRWMIGFLSGKIDFSSDGRERADPCSDRPLITLKEKMKKERG
jgi:2-hydroxy-3-keto-5-methylthiopentenyl-1-phosphate phosphatase